jgi:hypothetical protein
LRVLKQLFIEKERCLRINIYRLLRKGQIPFEMFLISFIVENIYSHVKQTKEFGVQFRTRGRE